MRQSKDLQSVHAPASVEVLGILTSLRGIAALWVLTHNDTMFRTETGIDRLSGLVERGYLAVDFFLVLSGFVLTYVYAAKFTGFCPRHAWGFIVNRIARIYPLYVTILLGRASFELVKSMLRLGDEETLQVSSSGEHSLPALLANLGMIQAWGLYREPTWIPSFWSVSVEWFAYLAFPILLFLLTPILRLRLGKVATLLFMLASLSFVSIRFNSGSLEFPYQFSLARCLPEFVSGMALATIFLQWRALRSEEQRKRDSAFANIAIFPLLGGGLLCVHFNLPDSLFLALTLPLILLSSMASGQVEFFATARPLLYLGELSYAIYLTHMPVQGIWRDGIAWAGVTLSPSMSCVGFVVKLVVIIGLSVVLHHQVEIPARRAIRSWASTGNVPGLR